jgi:thioredoxin reductase (NADPH)
MSWCITCDGSENRGRNILVVGHTTNAAAGEASLTDRIRLLTNSETDEISPAFRQRLKNAGIPVIHDHIRAVEGADGLMTTLVTRRNQRLELDSLFSIQGANPETGRARQLGDPARAQGRRPRPPAGRGERGLVHRPDGTILCPREVIPG